jgi:undecaprenyl-diphosphatase
MIFDVLKAVVLGIVEGFTEFLPISSTGHLILVNQVFSFEKRFTILFDIVIQLGAILSVLFYFRKRLWLFGKDQEKNKEILNLWQKTIVGVLPAIVLGFFLGETIEEKLFNPVTVALALIIGGIILILVERKNRQNQIDSIKNLSFKTAFFVGLIQCLAMIPGVSRSAATIIGAILLGASRPLATEFSFFLAIPTMIAASGYSLLKYGLLMSSSEFFILAVGFIVSFLTALVVIKFFLDYVQKHDFKAFGYYRIVLGVLILLLFFVPAIIS